MDHSRENHQCDIPMSDEVQHTGTELARLPNPCRTLDEPTHGVWRNGLPYRIWN